MADSTLDPNKAFKSIYNTLLNPNNSYMLQMIHSKDEPAAKQLLRMFGLDPENPKNLQDLFDLSTMIKENETTDSEQSSEDKAKQAQEQTRQEYQDAVRRIMQLDPKTRLLYSTLTMAGEGAHAAGKASRNNGNRLAQAILEGQRDHSAEQDRIYGPSIRDKTNAMFAADTVRRGENGGALWDAVGNAINKILGMTQQNDLTVRQMNMIPYDKEMNMSGNYYQMMNQDRKRAFNAGRE